MGNGQVSENKNRRKAGGKGPTRREQGHLSEIIWDIHQISNGALAQGERGHLAEG